MTRWKVTSSYDGTDFQGWQSQRSGLAVQDVIERALQKVFQQEIRIHGAGRTDAGVHAYGQVFHFDADWKYEEEKLRKAIHSHLPLTVRLGTIESTQSDFHARFSATGKRYRYHWRTDEPTPFSHRYCWHVHSPPDYQMIQSALPLILGEHDFTAFAGKVHPEENPRKTMMTAQLQVEGDTATLTFEGTGFLYKMVRSLVGTIYKLGIGKLTPDEFKTILNQTKRTPAVFTAPASGLFLDRVLYCRARSPAAGTTAEASGNALASVHNFMGRKPSGPKGKNFSAWAEGPG